MRALTYQSAKDVRVETVSDPAIEASDDIVLRVTATAICGSDLHIYRGKIPAMKDGDILGHEFMGIVEKVGAGVTALRPGDRVVVPFVIACGSCFYCNKTLFAACETTARGRAPFSTKRVRRRSGAVWIQPPVWRLRWRAGGVRARSACQCRAAQNTGRAGR